MWLTLPSVVLYNFAFFFPERLGFCSLLSLIILGVQLYKLRGSYYKSACAGFIWGALSFGCQLIWFLAFLFDYSKQSGVLLFLIYSSVVCFYALTSMVWAILTAGCLRIIESRVLGLIVFLVSTCSYFLFLDRYGASFIGQQEGYSFFSPLIPLAASKLFIAGVVLVSSWLWGPNYFYQQLDPSIEIIHLKPFEGLENLEQRIFHQLCDEADKLYKKGVQNKFCIFVAPESYFSKPLNNAIDTIKLWSTVLPEKSTMLVGTHYQKGDQLFQSVVQILSCRINNFYVKKHRAAFIECIPKRLEKWESLRKIFSQELVCFSQASETVGTNLFMVSQSFSVLPQICSEFFFKTSSRDFDHYKGSDQVPHVFFFLNDHWFLSYFRKNLKLSARLKSAWIGLPALYIGHKECMCVAEFAP